MAEQGERAAELISHNIKTHRSDFSSSNLRYPTGIIDELLKKEVSILRRARFLQGFARSEQSLRLAQKILSGDFEGGSDNAKSIALAWCSRVIAVGEQTDQAAEFVSRAKELGNGPETAIAEAFIVSAKGDFEGALGKIAGLDTPRARSAAFMIATNHNDATTAVDWLSTVDISLSDLDADGKFFLITKLLELGRWNMALEYTESLNQGDYEDAPVLFYTAAIVNLMQAIPAELRSSLPRQVPFEAARFPLASDETSLAHRRKAQNLLEKSISIVRELGCVEASYLIEDYALWLELRDPQGRNSGLQKLQASMREHSLRSLHLAPPVQLNLNL